MTWTAATLSSTAWAPTAEPSTSWGSASTSYGTWNPTVEEPGFLLMAEGFHLLQEDGFFIELEQGNVWGTTAIPVTVWTNA